jgi:hypothetical protein
MWSPRVASACEGAAEGMMQYLCTNFNEQEKAWK